jgi:hypothetical protein
MTKPKTARDILIGFKMCLNEIYVKHKHPLSLPDESKAYNQALSALSALINEAVGELIKGVRYDNGSRFPSWKEGYNQAKAEIRARLKEIGL